MNPAQLRLGSEAEFAALRTALDQAGFTEPGLCARLGLKRVSQYRLEGAKYFEQPPEDPAGLLIWLLLAGEALPRASARRIPLPELEALGVVTPNPSNPNEAVSTVMLYPMHGLYIVSDRPRPVQGKWEQPPEDFVYPAIVPNTDLFLSMLPDTPCDACLDLCSGTGIAAMAAARSGARHAWAFDVTERSTLFAEFNRRLNAISNVTVAQGDLYEPAAALAPDLTFDRIVVHPPYVPVYRPQLIFDSGGQDGEQIVRRIIEGLPRYLRPGGRFYGLTLGTDRDRPFEPRLRDWLGPAEAEFDVAFTVHQEVTPHAYAAEAVVRNRGRVDDIPAWRELFKQLGITGMPYGILTIQRRDHPRPVFTVRRQAGARTGPAEHAWMLDWETSVALGKASDLLHACPRASHETSLHIEQRLTSEGWQAQVFRLEIEYPFRMEIRAQAWTAHMLALADGSLTGAELLDRLKAGGALHPETPPAEYARMLALLVSGGFLKV